jgi:hypothetical protein
LLRAGEAARQTADPLQRAQIRSPNPSLQNGFVHLRQVRSAAMSVVALVVAVSVSIWSVVIVGPRLLSPGRARQWRFG